MYMAFYLYARATRVSRVFNLLTVRSTFTEKSKENRKKSKAINVFTSKNTISYHIGTRYYTYK